MKVCVTGASGFIATHIVEQLLAAGHEVVGTVRSPERAEKYTHLTALDTDGRLTLAGGNLLEDGSYDDAVAGCEVVMHTASPYVVTVDDPERDLVTPALNGTLNVLNACLKADSVKRVVLTSSGAAISDEPVKGQPVSEADWNEKSSLTRNAYYYSKVRAEKAAWKFLSDHEPSWDLVTINPFLVIGPAHTKGLNTSNNVISSLLTGAYPVIASLSWAIVDVRDVARAHLMVMEDPSAKGRHLLATATMDVAELVSALKQLGYGGYKLPKLNMAHAVGNVAVRLFARTEAKGVRDFILANVGKRMEVDNSKMLDVLGLQPMPIEDTLRDTVEDLKRWGHVPEL